VHLAQSEYKELFREDETACDTKSFGQKVIQDLPDRFRASLAS